MSSTESRVVRVVAKQLGVGAERITQQTSFVDDLGADSMDTVELVMALETEFGIQITDDAAERITTVQQAVDYINSQSTTTP